MSREHGANAPGHPLTHKNPRLRAMKRAFKRFSKKMLGWVLIALGFMLIAASVVLFIIPFHYMLAVVGLILVLRNAFWARRQFIHLKRRHPNWIMPIRKLLRRRPQFASVFWQQTLRVERFFLRSRHVLGGWRRRFFRRTRAAA